MHHAWHAGLRALDWQLPWYATHADAGRRVAALCLDGLPLCEALGAAAPCPVRPVPIEEMPPDRAYEQHIFTTGTVPTRDGLHDFFHGLAWHLFPAVKQRMNALQAAELARHGVGPTRGRLRDRLTVMDESGAFLHAPDALWEALAAKDWLRAFGSLRPLWRQSRLWILGHALLEQLATPRKNLTAPVWRLHGNCDSAAEADLRVAGWLLQADHGIPEPAHLPVLGIPGWHAANEDPDFYADTRVFRPPRAVTTGAADARRQ